MFVLTGITSVLALVICMGMAEFISEYQIRMDDIDKC